MNSDVDFAGETDEGQSSGIISSLPIIFWERRWLIIIPFLLIALAGTAAAFLLPQTYRSSATLLVVSQDLPGETSEPSGGSLIDRRIAKIRQQILSRTDLVNIIQTNNLYDAASRSQPLSVLVDKMRDATRISAVDADIKTNNSRGSAGSIAFSLTFDYPKAPQAQLVAQTFVEQLLKLDATETQGQAATNVNFLQDQQTALQTQVQAIEGEINSITGRNGAALASTAGMSMIGLSGGDYEGQIAALRRQNAELEVATGKAGVGRDPNVLAAEAQLAVARAQFSDDHPDVKLGERRLAAAKAAASSFQSTNANPVIQRQIAANNESIARLSGARAAELGRAATLAAAQARGPLVAQKVAQLQAQADNLRTNLSRISTNLLNARSMSKLAQEQRGERLTLIDPPVTPDTPSSPNRPLLIAGGMLGGLAFGMALALLAEFIAQPIRSVAALTKLTGTAPLAVVPLISKKRVSRKAAKRKRDATASVASSG